jgi:hypothetical protein
MTAEKLKTTFRSILKTNGACQIDPGLGGTGGIDISRLKRSVIEGAYRYS